MQHNELTSIPRCILELPNLQELNLSANHLTEIPDIHEWSPGLTVLDLSHNELSNLPLDIVVPSIRTLNISHNRFRTVPLCVCSFVSLQILDISENTHISSLPVEMGRLTNLNKLYLRGLKDLSDPPRHIQRDARDCIRYLDGKLRSKRKFYRMKLMLLGKQNRGKTTLVARLQGLDVGQNQSTVGVDISEWHYAGGFSRRKYQFSIWDFGGQEEYYATHQCFLSQRSMYLLLWNVKHGEEGIKELKPWLDNIALRAPRSCVLIVGTHLDEVDDSERSQIDGLLAKVASLAAKYTNSNKLIIPEVLAVGLMNRLENISTLREAIYNQATVYKGKSQLPVMGQEIPASYFQLNKELEKVQEEVQKGNCEPVMHAEQFKDLVQQLKLPDICSDDELRTATLFLNEVGTILHYDDRTHNLNELYFIDPRWLCDMMSKVVTVRERNPFIKAGILLSKDIPFLFRDGRFPWKYFGQYLTLLDRFEIALPLDNRRILIPSMLPEERPEGATIPDTHEQPLYRRYITYGSQTPFGFWSRLISRIMHSVPQVCKALDIITKSEEFNESQIFLLPNIQRFIISDDEPLRVTDFTLLYWREGIVYKGRDLSFGVESLVRSKRTPSNRNGILVMATPSGKGTKTICQLVDMIVSLIHEWYPGLEETAGPYGGMEQWAPCYECLKLGREHPFEFKIDQYMSLITSNRLVIECGYNRDDPNKNHNVSLADIMPDLLLQDLDGKFLLKAEEIKYQEDQDSLLGEGGFGKVYRGKCKGKSVAIKKYLTRNKEAFSELRTEAKVLQKSHHPCLVCLVGVSVYPLMALVLEEAPMGSLERHLIKKLAPIPRLVMFRMAAQVAAALRFLHSRGIIFRDLKAADVLLWSLNEHSLCHCKVTDFGIATHLSPFGTLGVQGTKGFIAPEVLFIGRKRPIYNHRADIFSFSMLLYQMIARRHPFHNIQPVRIDAKIVAGDRPTIVDVPVAETGYFYLTRVMEKCWADKPENRPSTNTLITHLSNVALQSVMAIHPVRSRFSLRRGCAITPHDYAKANVGYTASELWICCDGPEGAQLNIFNTNRMIKISKNLINENQVQCMCVCWDHMWICSRADLKYCDIDIFSIISRELVYNIRMREDVASCITCSSTTVYVGTLEGFCLAFSIDLSTIMKNARPRRCYISQHAVDGIVVTKKYIWVSSAEMISLLDPKTLSLQKCLAHFQYSAAEVFIGSLAMSQDETVIWSAFVGRATLSAWSVEHETHCFDICTDQVFLKQIDGTVRDIFITYFTPAMDCVWVGMATGHIMLFHDQELITYIRPYKEYVRFLVPIPCEGPCQKEKCMVVSGAKGFQSPIDDFPIELPESEGDKGQQPLEQSGVMILFEAYSGVMLKQMKKLEESAPGYLDNHSTVGKAIRMLHFHDDTHILEEAMKTSTSLDENSVQKQPIDPITDNTFVMSNDHRASVLTQSIAGPLPSPSNSMPLKENIQPPSLEPTQTATPTETFYEFPFSYKEDARKMQKQVQEQKQLPRPRARSQAINYETLEVVVRKKLTIRFTCPKPVTLQDAMDCLAREANEDVSNYCMAYKKSDSGEVVMLTVEEKFSEYLEIDSRPKLLLIRK